METVIQFLGSPTFGVVLSLLLIFQWYKQHAKDQAVKNSLFSMRRKICRNVNNNPESSNLYDMVDDIDAVLATLGSRKPFQKKLNKILCLIGFRNNIEENDSLIELNPERSEITIPLTETSSKLIRNKK